MEVENYEQTFISINPSTHELKISVRPEIQ